MSLACVLISDVTGSTSLFERHDNATALVQIAAVLDRMREIIADVGGHCVKARGDDVLSFFDHPDKAFRAAWTMINEDWPDGLSIHAGIYFGDILSHQNDIYGNAVNTAARLASLAKPGEILLGDTGYDDLDPALKAHFLPIGALPLRGKDAPTQVYACSVATLAVQTQVMGNTAAEAAMVVAAFGFADTTLHLEEGGMLRIGRAEGNEIVVDFPSVSRSHGTLSIRSGQLDYSDHSSTGSIVRLADGQDIALHRRTTLLSGSGAIVVGDGPEASRRARTVTFRLGGLTGR